MHSAYILIQLSALMDFLQCDHDYAGRLVAKPPSAYHKHDLNRFKENSTAESNEMI